MPRSAALDKCPLEGGGEGEHERVGTGRPGDLQADRQAPAVVPQAARARAGR